MSSCLFVAGLLHLLCQNNRKNKRMFDLIFMDYMRNTLRNAFPCTLNTELHACHTYIFSMSGQLILITYRTLAQLIRVSLGSPHWWHLVRISSVILSAYWSLSHTTNRSFHYLSSIKYIIDSFELWRQSKFFDLHCISNDSSIQLLIEWIYNIPYSHLIQIFESFGCQIVRSLCTANATLELQSIVHKIVLPVQYINIFWSSLPFKRSWISGRLSLNVSTSGVMAPSKCPTWLSYPLRISTTMAPFSISSFHCLAFSGWGMSS